MTTSFPAFSVGGETVKTIRSPSLYLDTSDLSYLLLGRIGDDKKRVAKWRTALLALLGRDLVRLRISPVHLAELALDQEVSAAGTLAIDEVPNVWLTTTLPDTIFCEELQAQARSQVLIAERQTTSKELGQLQIPQGSSYVSGQQAARSFKDLLGVRASAEGLGKRAARMDTPKTRRLALQLLGGDASGLPRWFRPAGRAFFRFSAWVLPLVGLTPELVQRYASLERSGLAWTVPLVGRTARLPRRNGKRWNVEDVQNMPATTLRACVEKTYHNDLRRSPDTGTVYDVEHLAYVAYADFSTIDAANFHATRSAREHLPHLNVFRTGNLDPVLAAIESSLQSPQPESAS